MRLAEVLARAAPVALAVVALAACDRQVSIPTEPSDFLSHCRQSIGKDDAAMAELVAGEPAEQRIDSKGWTIVWRRSERLPDGASTKREHRCEGQFGRVSLSGSVKPI